MCGICGIISMDGPSDLVVLRRMMARLHHRGPDGNGYYRDEVAALGHTRLAIVDPVGGAQPMSIAGGSIWVTFNGEIFNHVELAEQLRRCGHAFKTTSDTEVVLHAWQEWGIECFSRFNGQWALALWDRSSQRLILSRDRLGVRPLYYTRIGTGLRFASEIKALFADPAVRRAFDPAGIDETLTYWSTIAPRTVFQGIEQLEPGYYAMLDRRGFRKAPYWRIEFPDQGAEWRPGAAQSLGAGRRFDAEHDAQVLRETLVTATRLRFSRSDVPVGAYLSGGLDSSIIAAIISRHTDAPLHTFSLRFFDGEFDERRYQKEMVTALGTDHRDIVVSPADIASVFPEVAWHAETPILRTAPAPLFLLSKLVKDSGYKVVVTGEGADEILGGYDIFREARVRQFWARDLRSAKRARAVELLYPWMVRSPGQAPAFARSFFGRHLDPADLAFSHRPRWESTAAVKGMLAAEVRAEIARAAAEDLVAAMPRAAEGWDPLCRAQWLEMTTLLAGYILASQGDRMLMANSVEGRFPFLDHQVVDVASSMPAAHKLFGMEEKYLLKRAFADLVPERIRYRPKQPYRAPDAECFFGHGAPSWLGDVVSPSAVRDAGVFDPAAVSALLAKGARGNGVRMSNTDNMRTLAVISTQLIHASLIAGHGPWTSEHALPEPAVAVDRVAGERGIA